MNDWDFDIFMDKLKVVCQMLNNDNASKLETVVSVDIGKNYKIIIEEITGDEK